MKCYIDHLGQSGLHTKFHNLLVEKQKPYKKGKEEEKELTYENNGLLSFPVKRLAKPTLVPKSYQNKSDVFRSHNTLYHTLTVCKGSIVMKVSYYSSSLLSRNI